MSSFSLGHFYGRLIYGALDRYSGRAPDRVAIGFRVHLQEPGATHLSNPLLRIVVAVMHQQLDA
jgi:hypothetical protein